MPDTAPQLMTVAVVARRLHCSVAFVYDLLNSGRMKHYVLGKGQGGKRVSEEQLEEYLRQSERGGRESSKLPTQLKHIR
jgi:excisionase family DNA binding protein